MNEFTLTYEGFDPAEEGLREPSTSTGNGYLCAAATAEWEDANDVDYPGTYMHGVYDRETGGVPQRAAGAQRGPGRSCELARAELHIDGDEALGLAEVELLDYRHELDIRHALMVRQLRFHDRSQRETTLRSRRFVSMADPHYAGIEWTLTPLIGWVGWR